MKTRFITGILLALLLSGCVYFDSPSEKSFHGYVVNGDTGEFVQDVLVSVFENRAYIQLVPLARDLITDEFRGDKIW